MERQKDTDRQVLRDRKTLTGGKAKEKRTVKQAVSDIKRYRQTSRERRRQIQADKQIET